MSLFPEQVYSAFDAILGTTFRATTREMLLGLMNSPYWRGRRAAVVARIAGQERLKTYEPAIIAAAAIKRTRKNQRRRWHCHRGAYHYSYLTPEMGQRQAA